MATFKYDPLPTLSTIRLVFLPITEGLGIPKTLELSLIQEEISSVSKRYFALSYVWGDPVRVHTIKVNGHDFAITDNLMFFLRRERKISYAFWIDALCIDQDNKDEKDEQIGRMRDIYQNALRVYADLGPASEDEEVEFKKMETLSKSIVADSKRIDLEGIQSSETAENVRLSSILVEPYDIQFWRKLGDFFGRPWWMRVWIMQEATALHPANTYLLCGKIELPLSHAFGCAATLHITQQRRPWGEIAEPATRPSSISRVLRLRTMRKNNDLMPLLDILEHFRGLEATDLRDIINAALNIANDVKKGEIQTSYQASVLDAYRAVAIHFLKDSIAPLKIFSYCGTRFQHLEVEPGWASWIPSFYHGFPRTVLNSYLTADDGSQRPCYNPCSSEIFSTEMYPNSIEGETLHVYGFPVDTLTALTWPCITLSIQDGIDIVDKWIPSDSATNYFTGETMLTAFLRTVVADISTSHHKVQRGNHAHLDPLTGRLIFREFDKSAERIFEASQFRRLAYSAKGYMALVSHQAREGDILYALIGGPMLYVLRPRGGGKFVLVGECYVHGMMDGEVMQLVKEGMTSLEMVSIV